MRSSSNVQLPRMGPQHLVNISHGIHREMNPAKSNDDLLRCRYDAESGDCNLSALTVVGVEVGEVRFEPIQAGSRFHRALVWPRCVCWANLRCHNWARFQRVLLRAISYSTNPHASEALDGTRVIE